MTQPADRFHGTDDDFDPHDDTPVDTGNLARYGDLGPAVARFVALSDTAGNPGFTGPAYEPGSFADAADLGAQIAANLAASRAGNPGAPTPAVPLVGPHAPARNGCRTETHDGDTVHWCDRAADHTEHHHRCACGHVWPTPGPGVADIAAVAAAARVSGPTCRARYCLSGSHTHTCTRPYAHTNRGHHCACGDGWSANPDELPHPFAQVVGDTECGICGRDLADLLHAAPTSCICGPRGDGTGPYDGDPDPDCPEHGPSPHARPVAGPGHHDPVHRFNQVDDKLDALHAKLDQVADGLAAHYVRDHPDVARTLSAMDRVTQTPAEQVIASVLATRGHEETRAAELAEAIAEALYGPTTETTEPPGELVPDCDTCRQWFEDNAHALVRRTFAQTGQRYDADTVARWMRDYHASDHTRADGPTTSEGAPTEGDGRRPLDLRGHSCTRPIGPPGPPYGEPPACGKPATEVDSIGRPRCPEHLDQAQTATSLDDEGDEPRCGATLNQGCNVTGNVHRCHTAPHQATGWQHECECGTRWPANAVPGTVEHFVEHGE